MQKSNLTLLKYGPEDFELYKTLVYDESIMKYVTGSALTPEKAEHYFKGINIIGIIDPENTASKKTPRKIPFQKFLCWCRR